MRMKKLSYKLTAKGKNRKAKLKSFLISLYDFDTNLKECFSRSLRSHFFMPYESKGKSSKYFHTNIFVLLGIFRSFLLGTSFA